MSVKITQFEAENVKRIKALTLTPEAAGLTVIGGRNNQGKTSALDAIMWALGGERYRPPNAVAWCLHHDRGMNYNYIRRKHCLSRKVCKHLRWLAEERSV